MSSVPLLCPLQFGLMRGQPHHSQRRVELGEEVTGGHADFHLVHIHLAWVDMSPKRLAGSRACFFQGSEALVESKLGDVHHLFWKRRTLSTSQKMPWWTAEDNMITHSGDRL